MSFPESRLSIIKKRGYRLDIKGSAFLLSISNYFVTAKYLKERLRDNKKVLAELCCGVGVTLEQMAEVFRQVIGVDNDKAALKACYENLKAVKLFKKATLVNGDINEISVLQKIRADVAIYDVPYWIPHEYRGEGDFRDKNPPLKETVEKIRKYITPAIVVFCSPHYTFEMVNNQLGDCEYQKVFINGKYDRNIVYLGNLIAQKGIAEIHLHK